ncbi:MAG: Rrf2 family transcriptional regulator [Alphaproteobacteria bacterium]|nr:Rrf2 family transcriptional regulator [Alphaproteobacteria bacterium]
MSSLMPELPYTARYALIAVTTLAALQDEERLRSADLARETGAPRPFLAKVMRSLSQAGIVDGLKGHHGGYALARPASEISLGEVLEALGGEDAQQPQCALNARPCNSADPCALHHCWSEAMQPVRKLLARYTVADILEKRPLRRVFLEPRPEAAPAGS